jgi:hypothetical protein
MAKQIKYIFTMLTAAYFLFAGLGFNVVKYCCKGCKRQITETRMSGLCKMERQPMKDKCCQRRESTSKKNTNCFELNQRTKMCFFMRLNVDVPSIETINIPINSSVKCIDLFYARIRNLKIDQQLVSQNNYPPPNHYFLKTGRKILALKAVLLI